MGVLTHAQLVTEALELAGNIGLTTRAQTWLGLVLRHLSEWFTFPQQVSMTGQFTCVIGSANYAAGGDEASQTPTPAATSTLSGKTVRGIRRILLQESVAVSATNAVSTLETELSLVTENNRRAGDLYQLGAQSQGKPLRAALSPYLDGFFVTLFPTPDKAYVAVLEVDAVWPSLSYSASVVNPYPDDLTIIQGIYALALRHQVDERAAAEWGEFERLAREGRVRYGNLNPDNKKLQLASSSFRPKSATVQKPWDWMGRK